MNIFILDDEQDRHERIANLFGKDHVYTHAHSYDEAMTHINSHFDLAFIDNDLTPEHYRRHMESASPLFDDTGYSFVKYLSEIKIWKDTLFIVHTMNPVAGHIILRMLSENNMAAMLLPIYCLPDDAGKMWLSLHKIADVTSALTLGEIAGV